MIPIGQIPTPSYVLEEEKLEYNCKILHEVQKRTGCKIILALKAFSSFYVFPLLRKYLNGTTASSINEARLGYEEFGKEVHVYSAAYSDADMTELLKYADHITFNSFSQWQYFKDRVMNNPRKIECAIRINPEHSEVAKAIYDPCSKYSRLGVTIKEFKGEQMDGISGLHFHNLCELNFDSLERTLKVVEEKFGHYLHQVKWINFGGGHHITKADYDVDLLCKLINNFKKKYNVEVILEPGEAVVLKAGLFITRILDIIKNEKDIAILDCSATAHLPDVLEMPYRPQIQSAGEPNEFKYTYRLGGMSCLAGDVIGDYSFSEPLKIGQKLVFLDMAQYTIVKNTTFNGISLPSIGIITKNQEFKLIKSFGYQDFKSRQS